MAPEQIGDGRKTPIGPAVDIYSLGALLYHLITGRPPFQGETPLETLQQVCDGEPPRPGALRPGLPRDLDTVCMKCLEKRRDRLRELSGSQSEPANRIPQP